MTRALINQNTMQDLRDKLADRDRDLLASNIQNSQQSQTASVKEVVQEVINVLRPFPLPAYLTASPYQSTTVAYGCNTGCGCAGYNA